MECILMNFDDRARIVHDVNSLPVQIAIGGVKPCDLPESIVQFIRNAMDKQDPLVIVDAVKEQPAEIIELMSILRDIEAVGYDEVLERTMRLLGKDNVEGLRPSRAEMRFQLREIAGRFAAGRIDFAAEAAASKQAAIVRKDLPVRDDRDPDELDAAIRKQREIKRRTDEPQPQGLPPHVLTAREKMDMSLGVIGTGPEGLAEALNQPPKSDEFDPKRARPEPSKKRSRSKQAKKPKRAPTSSAAKNSAKPKKPVARVRA